MRGKTIHPHFPKHHKNNLLFHPGLFDAYAIASPMLGWCPGFLLNETRKFLEANPALTKKLYVDYGGLDYIDVLDTIIMDLD